jgi:hypothetical protein
MLIAIHITLSYDLNAKYKTHLQDKRARGGSQKQCPADLKWLKNGKTRTISLPKL